LISTGSLRDASLIFAGDSASKRKEKVAEAEKRNVERWREEIFSGGLFTQ